MNEARNMVLNGPLLVTAVVGLSVVGVASVLTGYSFLAILLFCVSLSFGASFVVFIFLLVVSPFWLGRQTAPLRHDITPNGFVERSTIINLHDHDTKNGLEN
ncbi:hypothetical protein [Gymnodinialimonas sp.]